MTLRVKDVSEGEREDRRWCMEVCASGRTARGGLACRRDTSRTRGLATARTRDGGSRTAGQMPSVSGPLWLISEVPCVAPETEAVENKIEDKKASLMGINSGFCEERIPNYSNDVPPRSSSRERAHYTNHAPPLVIPSPANVCRWGAVGGFLLQSFYIFSCRLQEGATKKGYFYL